MSADVYELETGLILLVHNLSDLDYHATAMTDNWVHMWSTIRGLPFFSVYMHAVSFCFALFRCVYANTPMARPMYIEGTLPKGPYLPCVSMAGRALLAGCHRYTGSQICNHCIVRCPTHCTRPSAGAVLTTKSQMFTMKLILLSPIPSHVLYHIT